MKRSKNTCVFQIILLSFVGLLFANPAESWKLIGISGTSYNIDVLKNDKGIFVPSYQILKHLNIQRSEKGDTITAKYNKNELKLIKNSNKYLFNTTQKTLKHATIYKDGTNYSDIASFCDAMNALTGLFFDYNLAKKEIRVSKARPVNISDDGIFGIIVIDPGHGGKDPGAIGAGGIQEKDVVLPIAMEVKKYLEKYKNLKVYLTREDDKFIPLGNRIEFANKKNADLFISIHTNAAENKSENLGGYKMYFLSDAKNESDERTAMFENSVVALENKKEADGQGLTALLSSLASNEYLKESQDISIMLEKSFGKNLKELNKLHSGIGQANFHVLAGALMPAVLVETAFISNPKEEKLLENKNFHKKTGEAIGMAIVEFRKKYGAGEAK